MTRADFLALPQKPARLAAWETAVLLGVEDTHVPVLVSRKLLRPLGHPPANGPKFFARDYVLTLAADQNWLARASDALVDHWANRNRKQSKKV